MKGYLSPETTDSGVVPIESRAEVYRDPDRGQEIVVETPTGIASLDIADVTVSRKKGDDPPVVLISQSESIEIRNQGNSNGVVVRTDGETREIDDGFSERVRRDAVIELGYQTELRLTVERDPRVEVQGGDYVAGDKTEVTDSVVNRSEIGTGQPADAPEADETDGTVDDSVVNRSQVGNSGRVDDSVVNRSNVGETPTADTSASSDDPTGRLTSGGTDDQTTTRNVCEVHQITYTGQTCPKCARSAEQDTETKFCLFCGESIPERAQICPQCGEELPDS